MNKYTFGLVLAITLSFNVISCASKKATTAAKAAPVATAPSSSSTLTVPPLAPIKAKAPTQTIDSTFCVFEIPASLKRQATDDVNILFYKNEEKTLTFVFQSNHFEGDLKTYLKEQVIPAAKSNEYEFVQGGFAAIDGEPMAEIVLSKGRGVVVMFASVHNSQSFQAVCGGPAVQAQAVLDECETIISSLKYKEAKVSSQEKTVSR